MLKHIRPAFVMIVAMTAITGFAYPFAMTGLAHARFSSQANGSLIERDGRLIGSELIGQAFSNDRYFTGRPSSTMGPDPTDSTKSVATPYNAANSGASNLAPTNRTLLDRVQSDIDTLRGQSAARPPMELVTSSGSGLDPHISPEAAMFQAPRVARARGLPVERIQALVNDKTEGRFLGILGEPRVNVLSLNIALDDLR